MARTPPVATPEDLDRRQKRLLGAAWAATLLPLIAFAYLTWESWKLNQQVDAAKTQLMELDTKKKELEAELRRTEEDLRAQRSSAKHYRDVTGIQIRFYRESDREIVQNALVNLGFKVDTNLGRSTLIDREPNTIAYGRLVSTEDLREIAAALVQAGFPLKRIAPAVRQPDPKLIQIYASAESERACGLLSVDQIRAGMTCGNTP